MDSNDPDPRHPQRKKLPHDIPWWVPEDSAWFVTINCIPPGKPQLCRHARPGRVTTAVLDAAGYYHDLKSPRWFLHLFLLMPDHLHAVLSFPPGTRLKPTVSAWKGYVKKHHGIVWQTDFFDHRLRSEASRAEKLEYIRMNPVRKGLCENPEDWPLVISFDPRTGEETSYGSGSPGTI